MMEVFIIWIVLLFFLCGYYSDKNKKEIFAIQIHYIDGTEDWLIENKLVVK